MVGFWDFAVGRLAETAHPANPPHPEVRRSRLEGALQPAARSLEASFEAADAAPQDEVEGWNEGANRLSAARPRVRSVATWACLWIAAIVLAGSPACAEIEPGDLTLTVTPERNGGSDPYPREMVLLHIRGVYKQAILLEDLVQPSLANFSWTQLGRDRWGKTKLPDGQNAISFERTIAVFPHHHGAFVIEPFTHRLTVNDAGERRLVPVRSQPIPFAVARWPEEAGGPDAREPWWLPAKEVTITDSWSPDPETVKVGESTRRVVTLEARGLVAEGLPPRPVMRTRGILTFAGPVTRETILTPAGPVARATYQWDIRPGVPEVIPLDAVTIPWFDTATRTMREAEIPARQIGGGVVADADERMTSEAASPALLAAAGLIAFGLGLLLIGIGARTPRLRLPHRIRRDLRRAARAGDARRFQVVLDRATAVDRDLARAWRRDPATAAGLAALARDVYGREAGASDLSQLARLLSRPVPTTTPDAATSLRPLDGPMHTS